MPSVGPLLSLLVDQMISREQQLKLLGTLATASLTGVGLAIGGTFGPVVLAGIGINLSSSIIENGFFCLKERWLNSSDGLLNHDIQKALARAFVKGLSSLETKYFALEEARVLQDHEQDSIRELFREFRGNAKETLLASAKSIVLSRELVDRLFSMPNADSGELWESFVGDNLISAYGSHFRDFIRQNLIEETMLWFAEELKTDNVDSNRAWRAFQRMILEGIYADVKSVRASQDLISQDLQKLDPLKAQLEQLREMIDRRLPDELFQQELKAAIFIVNSNLREIARTNQRIDRHVDDIRKDVKQLLNERPKPEAPEEIENKISQIRQSMITAPSRWELREASYRLDQILAEHPHHFEARNLKDQLADALNYEARLKYAPMASPGPAKSSDCVGTPPSRFLLLLSTSVVLVLFILLLYLVFRWIW
jgi:DNA-binding transcriptional regulator GbsR (MarR family)